MENNPKIHGNSVWIDPRVNFGKNVTVGHGSCIGYPDEDEDKLEIMDNVKIGAFCVVSMGSKLERNVKLEHYCRVDSESIIGEGTELLYGARVHWKVQIGKKCIIGGNCVDRTIMGNNVRHFGRLVHQQRKRDNDWNETEEPSPVIHDDVLIGANAIIVGGITIGKGSIIGAGEIVTKDIPSNSIFRHNTCKPLKNK